MRLQLYHLFIATAFVSLQCLLQHVFLQVPRQRTLSIQIV